MVEQCMGGFLAVMGYDLRIQQPDLCCHVCLNISPPKGQESLSCFWGQFGILHKPENTVGDKNKREWAIALQWGVWANVGRTSKAEKERVKPGCPLIK
jgi:hypothetical protein